MTEKSLKQYCKEHAIENIFDISYSDLIESLGVKILVKENTYDWQGDSLILLRDEDNKKKHGLLIFGWESCPMCNALQDCFTEKDLEKLRKFLKSQIIWKNSLEECYLYILGKDFNITHIGEELVNRFQKAVGVLINKKKETPEDIRHRYGMYGTTSDGKKILLYKLRLGEKTYENSLFSKVLEFIE